MSKKQNIFYAYCAFLFLGLGGGALPARASESVSSETPYILPTSVSGPALVIDQLLTHVRARDRVHAFSLLSSAQHAKYQGNAENFMKTLRVMYHAMYDHQTYRILTPVMNGEKDGASTLVKIQLVDHNGDETLGVIHVIQKQKGVWKIDGMTIFLNDRGRDA